MDFDLRSDLEKKKKPVQPGPNYFSPSVRLRLGMLVAMLGMVFVAMHEASKPETWERLGFGATATTPQPNPESLSSMVDPLSPDTINAEVSPDLFHSFWVAQYNQLSLNEKKILFQLLRDVRNRRPTPTEPDPAKQLIVRFRQSQKSFVTQHVESLSDADQDSIERALSLLTLPLVDENPNAMEPSSEDPATVDPTMKRLQSILDQQAYSSVEDRSSLSRPIEGMAWLRSWERLLERNPEDEGVAVSYLQLSGQPAAYRGQRIKVAGTVRAAETIPLKNHALGFDSYKVLWVKPEDSNRTPYCVYVRELPDGFPDPGDQFLELREPIAVDGLFFKLRSYVTADEVVEICPLLMANTFTWSPQATVAKANPWSPPVWLLISFFVGMPVVAILLAVAAYRSTTIRLFEPGQSAQQEIKGALVDLQKSPAVMTDQERVDELYRMDTHNE